MKIAIDISQIVFEGTGTANYTKNLVKNLLRLNHSTKKHQYLLFGASLRKKPLLDAFAFELRKEGLIFRESFWMLPPTFTSTVWNQVHHMKIERLIGKVDVFHSSDWTQPPTKAKKVTTIHDLVVYKFPESSNKTIVENQKLKLNWVKKEIDHVIAVSKSTKADVEEILKIPSDKISVIYEGVGEEFKEIKDVEEIKRKYNLTKKYVLGMGGIGARKNTNGLSEAFKKLHQPGLELAIIGKTLGFVPQSDLPALYSGAEVFVYPSFYEGFGLPVLESLASGTPVVTSNNSSLPELGGKAAFYVNPEDVNSVAEKIRNVLDLSPKDRKSIVKLGINQAHKFSWEKTAKETLSVYERLA